MRNTFALFIIQALVTLLLFFSDGPFRYITIALFLVIDIVLFINILMRKWSYEELLTFAALFCSVIFLVFYLVNATTITIVFGISLMLLFLVLAMIEYASPVVAASTDGRLPRPKMPDSEDPLYYYDIESAQEKIPVKASTERVYVQKKPEAVHHEINRRDLHKDVSAPRHTSSQQVSRSNTVAKALAYELEREASQIKEAERAMNELEVYNAEDELLKESEAMERAQGQIDSINRRLNSKEISKETKEILNVQKQINNLNNLKRQSQEKELKKQAKMLETAEKQVKQLQFLDAQEKIVKKAREAARKEAKKEIGNSKKPSSLKTIKSKVESFYFATKNGNKFHDPGCLRINKVPKNKLVPYTSRKAAMKKGLQPCNVCIPK